MNIDQTAKTLKVSKRTLYNMRKAGELKYYVVGSFNPKIGSWTSAIDIQIEKPDYFFTVKHLSKSLEYSETHVRRLIARGAINAFRVGKQYRISKEEAIKTIEKRLSNN